MTEAELRASYESDANGDPEKAGLEPQEVTALVKAWFYTAGVFDSLKANTLTSNYCLAVAAGYRKRFGKVPDPLKYLSQNTAVETSSFFDNFIKAEERWLRMAEVFRERETQDANASAGSGGTRTLPVSVRW